MNTLLAVMSSVASVSIALGPTFYAIVKTVPTVKR